MTDCKDAYNRGNKQDGIFCLPSFGLSQVRCDVTTAPKGWIVFQRRIDGTVDFNRSWTDYKNGFGDLNGNCWLGLENLQQLAAPGKGATLRIDLKHMDLPGEIRYAEYSLFEISNEAEGYRLKIGGYSGNAGDSLAYQNYMKFTAVDKDLDMASHNCAMTYSGAFWYNNCYHANLNGIYPLDNSIDNRYISWAGLTGSNGRISFCEMKMRL